MYASRTRETGMLAKHNQLRRYCNAISHTRYNLLDLKLPAATDMTSRTTAADTIAYLTTAMTMRREYKCKYSGEAAAGFYTPDGQRDSHFEGWSVWLEPISAVILIYRSRSACNFTTSLPTFTALKRENRTFPTAKPRTRS